ncbi:hypothetical protein GCM10020370_53580 [Paenibacillus hodogayensis]
MLKEGFEQAERIVKEVVLYAAGQAKEIKVVIYAHKTDPDYLHAALIRDGITYDIGTVAGYRYDQDDNLIVRNIMLFRKQVIQIQGMVGAAASMTRYIDVEDGIPKPLLLVEDGHAVQIDVDHDGLPEVTASSGTIPYTTIYRWKDGHIERSRLNDALQAEAVRITDEGAIEASFGTDLSQVRLYWLKENHLSQFASYSSEEYYSDRFVTIPYTPEEALQIRNQADALRIFEPLVPRKGIATDYGVDVREEPNGVLKMTFPHFSIYQSKTDLKPPEVDPASGTKHFFPGFSAQWIGPDEGGGGWYLQRGSTFISISTAKPYNADQLLFVAASLVPLEELKLPDGTATNTALPVTRDYLFALQAANEFATAWTHRDPENGLRWVSDAWKAVKEPLEADAYFRGTSNPHHMAFELSGKRKPDERTFLFDIHLYEYYTGQPDYVHGFPFDRRGWTLEVIKEGTNEWGEGIWRVNP